MVGNKSRMDSRHFFCDIWSYRTSEPFCSCYFLSIGSESRKVNDLLTSPSNQSRDYFTLNRIEKLVPQHGNFAPQTLNTANKTYQVVFKLDFLVKSGFPKTWDLSLAAPWGVYISRDDLPPQKKWVILANHKKRHFVIKRRTF